MSNKHLELGTETSFPSCCSARQHPVTRDGEDGEDGGSTQRARKGEAACSSTWAEARTRTGGAGGLSGGLVFRKPGPSERKRHG